MLVPHVHLFCEICLEPYSHEEDHTIFSTPCGHIFGRYCILRWFGDRVCSRCPKCIRLVETDSLHAIYADELLIPVAIGSFVEEEVAREDPQVTENRILKETNEELKTEVANLTQRLSLLELRSNRDKMVTQRLVDGVISKITWMGQVQELVLDTLVPESHVIYSEQRQIYCISGVSDGYVGVIIVGKALKGSRFVSVTEASDTECVRDMKLSPSGNLVAVAYDEYIYVVDIRLESVIDWRKLPGNISAIAFDFCSEDNLLIGLTNGWVFRKTVGKASKLYFKFRTEAHTLFPIGPERVLLTRESDICAVRCTTGGTPSASPIFKSPSGLCFPALLEERFKELNVEIYAHYDCDLDFFGFHGTSTLKIYGSVIIFITRGYSLQIFINTEGTNVKHLRSITLAYEIIDFDYSGNGLLILTECSAILYR